MFKAWVGRRCPSSRQNSRISTTNKRLQVSTNIVDITLQHVHDVTLKAVRRNFISDHFLVLCIPLRGGQVILFVPASSLVARTLSAHFSYILYIYIQGDSGGVTATYGAHF
jgi:hypothetical protein